MIMAVLLEKREAGGFVREGAFYNGSAGCVPMVFIAQTLPQNPKSPLQRYRLLRKGREVLA